VRIIMVILATAALGLLAGCQNGGVRSDENLIVIEFRPDEPLTYQLTSQRDILIELVDGQGKLQPGQSHKMSEQLDLQMTYTPTDVDPLGLTTIEARCDSAKVTRQGFRTSGPEPKDLAEKLVGKTFTFQVSPSGKPADTAAMDAALNAFIESGFVSASGPVKRIKDPDMVVDFLALQYHLWDSVAMIPDPLSVRAGMQWASDQLTPLPFPLPATRATTYTLRDPGTGETPKAVMEIAFALSDKEPRWWPPAYQEVFNLRGSLFAILRNYRFRSIEGGGQAVFDVTQGVLERETQEYKTVMDAAFMLPLGDTRPVITIEQKLRAERIASDGGA
jgi:hypothetical protein